MRRCERAFLLLMGLLAVRLTGCHRPTPVSSPPPSPSSPIRFRDVSEDLGINFRQGHGGKSPLTILETAGSGCAFLDFDRDGKLDILLVGSPRCALYRQVEDGFADWTDQSGLHKPGRWAGVAVGDVDNDGWPDLYLNGYRCAALFRNHEGKFRDETTSAGFPAQREWGTSAAFFDADNDGWLDLVTAQYVVFDKGSPQFCPEGPDLITCSPRVYEAQHCRIFRNVDKGRFLERTREAGLEASAGKTWSVIPFDYNGDGRMDLYAGNDVEPADLWHNEGGFRFTNAGMTSGTALSPVGQAQGGMGIDTGDVDGDGRLDLWVTTYEGEDKTLFRNRGDGAFDEIGRSTELSALRPLVSWGTLLEDFDADGFLDLAVVSGHVVTGKRGAGDHYAQPSRVFRGLPNAQFKDVSAEAGPAFTTPIVGRGMACGDYDRDGKVDLLVLNLEGRALLLRNETPNAGRTLAVSVRSHEGGYAALGARVSVTDGSRTQVREVRTARSVFSACDPTVRFGLGSYGGACEVEVVWPGSRRRTVEVPAGSTRVEVE